MSATLSNEQLLQIYDTMVKARTLEERLILMFKKNKGAFWIGGPGEEAFNVPLGMLINKGQGLDHDYLHHHYRSSAILIAMGMDPIGPMRQMSSSVNDPFSGGRNFSSHYSIPEWNVVPGTSPIETQYLTAIGTAIAQRKAKGITVVNGGDAGSAEGDFASCLLWASRPDKELPMLIIVTNNSWGISTNANTQLVQPIANRAIGFNMKHQVINGNDPEESYFALKDAMEYVRTERKPFLMEAKISRMYGHSSASGAMPEAGVEDPLKTFEDKLIAKGLLTAEQAAEIRDTHNTEQMAMADQAASEPTPDGSTKHDYTFHQQTGKYW